MRVLICAIASVTLIITGTLVMDWYRLSFDGAFELQRIALDLRSVHLCRTDEICASVPLAPLPGMFPTLAAVTLWASLGVAALVAFMAAITLLTGNASEPLTRLGYMMSLLALSIAVATAYIFGPETEGPTMGVVAQLGVGLQRTWAPLTLIAGLIAGFASLYMAVAPESSDLRAEYKPVTLAPARAISDGLHARPPAPAPTVPVLHAGSAPLSQTMNHLLRPIPDHLRGRLAYVAITAELSGGGIDARREDGSSRLVLWRDVVGVVARRLPPACDSAVFVDIVSTAGSTLRIVPWTRLSGEPIDAEDDARPSQVVTRVVEKCPGAKLDPATRHFLDTGDAVQLPDLETLRDHDARLA